MSEKSVKTHIISEIREHSETIRSFSLMPLAAEDRLHNVNPGTFVLFWLPGVDEKPFAPSALRGDGLEITVKAVGPFTKKMMKLKKGERIGLRGPFGNGFTLRNNALLIGGGIGIAPLLLLADELKACRYDFKWVIGVKTKTELPFASELIGSDDCMIFSEDGTTGSRGLATDCLEELIRLRKPEMIFGAGPEGMLLRIYESSRTSGTAVQLSFERYMKCAVGICGQCCLDGSGIRLCVEGPVLDAGMIAQVTEWGLPKRGPSGRRAGT